MPLDAPRPGWPLEAVEWGTPSSEAPEHQQPEHGQVRDPNDELIRAEFQASQSVPPKPPPQMQPQTGWLRTSAEVDGLRASDENEAGDDGTAVEADAYPGAELKAAAEPKAAAEAPALAPEWTAKPAPEWLRRAFDGRSWV